MSGEIKFYFDEHVHSAVASGLRMRGVDVLTSQQANMLGVADEEHLRFALAQQRVIVTQDDDFLKLGVAHKLTLKEGQTAVSVTFEVAPGLSEQAEDTKTFQVESAVYYRVLSLQITT